MQRLLEKIKKNRFRLILSTVVASAVVLGIGFPYFGTQRFVTNAADNIESAGEPSAEPKTTQRVRRVRVETVSSQVSRDLAVYPGTTMASQASNLAFRVGGPLVEVNVKPGDHVRRGDVLMRIDPRDFETTLMTAQAALDSAKARLSAMKEGARAEDLRVLEANISAAASRQEYLQKDFERCEKLVKNNSITQQQRDSTHSQLKVATADIRALEQELVKAKAGSRIEDIHATEAEIRGLEARVKAAQDALADTRLTAPFDGLITRQLVENHEQLESGNVVVSMHNISTIEIDVDLPEKELVRRPLRQDGLSSFVVNVVFVAARGHSYQATLWDLSTQADPATKTYQATFAMPAPTDVNILPGMVAEVQVESHAGGSPGQERLMVPAVAVRGDGAGQRYVWTVTEGSKAQRRQVVVGRLTRDNQYEVISGVSAGERVVTSGAPFLHQGEAVMVMGDSSAAMNRIDTQVAAASHVTE